MAENNKGIALITVTVIGAVVSGSCVVIAAIIGAYDLFLTQERAISTTQTAEALHQTQVSQVITIMIEATETSSPTSEKQNWETPTLTNTPTPKPLLPTNTPTIKPPPVIQLTPTDTPPGTVLKVGETWIINGFYVKLEDIQFAYGNQAFLNFVFTNKTNRTVNLYINHDVNVIMKDDKGNLYTWDSLYENNASINPGLTWYDRVYKGGDLSRAAYFTIQLDIPGIISAQWKY